MNVDWNSIAIGCVMTAATHPFTYAKVLVQLGHEPLEPVIRRNMFFRKQLLYPNVFQYLKHIQKTDGYFGLYRGLFPRICANATTSITYTLVTNTFERARQKKIEAAESDVESPKTKFSALCQKTTEDMLARCAAVVISQPFHVIAIRTMAQFVGEETVYRNIYVSVVEIYSDEGILGFFSGMVPRLACEIISLWLCKLLTHVVNTYVINESSSDLKDLREYTPMVMGYFAQSVTYPLSVTSTIMATNGANLKAGNPPFIPHYETWTACLRDLLKSGQYSRGSSMFFRKVISHAYSAGSVMPVPVPQFS